MRQHYIIYNVCGITLSLIFLVSACGQVSGGGRGSILLWTSIVVLLVGGGSMVNFSERRFSVWPTVVTIIGYFVSVFLIPFGIWGIIALFMERRRQQRRRRRISKHEHLA
jgi:hypothetical protein